MEQEADSAEDEERDIPESQQETYLKRDKKTKWSRIKPPTNVRTRRHNIYITKQVRSESECLRLFLDDNILLESLVKYTHIYIELQVKVKEMHVSLIAQKSNP